MQSFRLDCLWQHALLRIALTNCSFPSEAEGNPHIELPQRLAGSSQIRTGVGSSQRVVTQPLRAHRVGYQSAQESPIAQTASCLSENDFRLHPNVGMDYAGAIPDHSVASLNPGTTCPLKVFQRLPGLMAAATFAIPLGLLHMRPFQCWLKAHVPSHAWHLGWLPIRVDHRCVRAVAPWMTSRLFQAGVRLGLTSRRKVVTTDASNSGWGALLECNPAFGSWSVPERHLLINCLEMLVVFLALKAFLLALKGHHVLVWSDSMMVVAYINRQGGLRSHSLDRMAHRLLFWAQKELLSLRAVHVPGRFNLGAYMLSRGIVAPGEWALHP